jgi:hypothetical protein
MFDDGAGRYFLERLLHLGDEPFLVVNAWRAHISEEWNLSA